jgi:hypothetical protein
MSMKKVYRTALGKVIDMDNLRLANEETIAVGNMKVNARGDELGPGGSVARSRNQVMDEYYRLNTPTAVDSAPVADTPLQISTPRTLPDVAEAAEPMSPSAAAKLKGNLANTFAKK